MSRSNTPLPSDPAAAAVATIDPRALVGGAQVGAGTRIFANAIVMDGAVIGRDCSISSGCFVERGAVLGDGVKLKNGVSVWDGVSLGDHAFIGPHAIFTNDPFPRSWIKPPAWTPIRVGRGASVGAGAVIVCGRNVGDFALVAAGAVVTRDVRPHELVRGNPARSAGWVCICGRKITPRRDSCAHCAALIVWASDGQPSVTGSTLAPPDMPQ